MDKKAKSIILFLVAASAVVVIVLATRGKQLERFALSNWKNNTLMKDQEQHLKNVTTSSVDNMTNKPEVVTTGFLDYSKDPEMKQTRIPIGDGCSGPDAVAVASNLMPHGDVQDEDWNVYVAPNGDNSVVPNQAFIGINTIGGSKKSGGNLQLRALPPNPRTVVSPWWVSTTPGPMPRQPLE